MEFKVLLSILASICIYSCETDDVTVTIYNAVEEQTNSDPGNTASMFELDLNDPYKHRIIAVSRDLYNEGYTFGTYVLILGIEEFSGVWVVEDLMNKRYENRIDLLVNEGTDLKKWNNIKIIKL